MGRARGRVGCRVCREHRARAARTVARDPIESARDRRCGNALPESQDARGEREDIEMADSQGHDIESVLSEARKFAPSPEFSRRASIKSLEEYEALCRRAQQDPEKF